MADFTKIIEKKFPKVLDKRNLSVVSYSQQAENAPNRKVHKMTIERTWTEDLSHASRFISSNINTIHSWAGARAGDTWHYLGESHIISKVTKVVDRGIMAIWYEIECEDGTKSSTPENMGHGEIRVTGQKAIA